MSTDIYDFSKELRILKRCKKSLKKMKEKYLRPINEEFIKDRNNIGKDFRKVIK